MYLVILSELEGVRPSLEQHVCDQRAGTFWGSKTRGLEWQPWEYFCHTLIFCHRGLPLLIKYHLSQAIYHLPVLVSNHRT